LPHCGCVSVSDDPSPPTTTPRGLRRIGEKREEGGVEGRGREKG